MIYTSLVRSSYLFSSFYFSRIFIFGTNKLTTIQFYYKLMSIVFGSLAFGSCASKNITSWDDLKRLFLAKFFPISKTIAIRKEISGIKQQSGESLYEYLERFKNLCSSCPHHQIPQHLLLQYFYEGLHHMDKNMIRHIPAREPDCVGIHR